MSRNEYMALMLLLKPFAMLLFFGLVLIPARMSVKRFMPEGKLKRFLLFGDE